MRYINKPQVRILSFLFSTILYLIFLLTVNFQNLSDGYQITVLLPIVFLVCFHVLLWNPVININTPYFTMYSVIAFVRFVILSLLTIESGTYNGISGIPVSDRSLTIAGYLMIWELVATSVFINYWSHRKFSKKEKNITYYSSNANINIYFLIVIFSVLLLFVFPQSREGLSFFGEISSAQNNEFESFITLGIRELFINAKYFLLFFIIILLQKKNGINFKKNKFLSYLTILMFVILIIGIRIGSNRKKMIADSIAALLLLWNIFPKYKKTTASVLAIIGIILVAWTTVYRGMAESTGAFLTNYFDLDILQAYFLGQYNIGIAIEAKELFSNMITLKSFVLGILRPIFGIGSLIQNINITYIAELFDQRMSMGIVGFRGDQILPLIAEGYMFFGFILSPILSIIIARIGVFFDKLYSKTRTIEILFISSLISFYLAQAMILNTTIILNMLSFRLAIYLPIYLLGRLMKKKKTSYLLENDLT